MRFYTFQTYKNTPASMSAACRETNVTGHSLFAILHLPLAIRHSPFSIRYSPSAIRYLLFTILPLLAACLWLLAAPTALAQQPAGAFETAECMFEVPFISFVKPKMLGFECGYVTVPEQHAQPDGPTLRLPVAILRAPDGPAHPDPLFLAQGGPGGDAFGVFSLTAPQLAQTFNRDIVIFNQRGTLYAEPSLVCSEVFDTVDEALARPPDDSSAEDGLQPYHDCRQRLLDEGVNLSAFNSLENAADVDTIRQALGYNAINFYGVSYGTLLGLHLMRDYPEHLRSVILDSVVPTQLNYITHVPQATERVFAEMFRACDDDPDCRASYPDLETQFAGLVAQLDEQPVTIPVTDPQTGDTVDVFVDGTTLVNMLFQSFYIGDIFAAFPKLVTDFADGDYTFWQLVWPQIAFDRTFSEGMFYAVMCAEDSDFTPEDVALDGVRPLFARSADGDLRDILDICQLWQVDPLPSQVVDAPVQSDIPTLLLAGQFDPITPPAFAAEAARTLSNGHLLVDPTASHGVAFNDTCLDGIVRDFLDNPQGEPDSACLQRREPGDFVPPNALAVPLFGKFNSLDGTSLALIGLAGLLLLGVFSAFIIWPLALVINVLGGKKSTATAGQKWLRRVSKSLVLAFGLLALLFVFGVGLFAAQAFGSIPMLLLSVVSGMAAPLFVIPWLLLPLALAVVGATILLWLKGDGSIWGKLYFTYVAICAAGYVAVLAATGMMTVLL